MGAQKMQSMLYYLLKCRLLTFKHDSNRGLTLIECLVAIVVIAASIAVITPAVVVAVATRVQSQQAEQAFQVAQAEIDRVKLIIDRGGDYTLNIAEVANTVATANEFEAEVDPPENVDALNAATFNYSTTLDTAKPVDVDDDGVTDFAVQIFRTEGSTSGTRLVAFDMGVRVYRVGSVENNTAAELATDQAELKFTSGEGQGGTRPLAVIYTTVVKGDNDDSLCNYYNFINSTGGTSVSTPSQC